MVVNLPPTWAEIDTEILEHHRLLRSSPRSDPHRHTLLCQLVGLRTQRFRFSRHKKDLDRAIIHSTEAILLSPRSQKVVLCSSVLQPPSFHASHFSDNLMISNLQSNTFAFFELTSTHWTRKLSTNRTTAVTLRQTYFTRWPSTWC